MKYHISAQTNVGRKRINNEDNFSVNERFMPAPAQRDYSVSATLSEGVLSVCDGMGGESYGENASLTGVQTFANNYKSLLCDDISMRKQTADNCVQSANANICTEMQSKKVRIGSTAVLACIKNDNAYIFNVGDSRAYIIRNGKLKQLSKDHTVLQQKIDNGAITIGDSNGGSEKHQLTQHLGIFESEMLIEAFYTSIQLAPNDVILLCSDGLTDMVSNDEIAVICSASQDAKAITSDLISKALENGGKDNVTVIVACAKNEETQPIQSNVEKNAVLEQKTSPQASKYVTESPTKKANTKMGGIILAIIAVVALACVLIFFLPRFLGDKENKNPDTSQTSSGNTQSETNSTGTELDEKKWPDQMYYEYDIPEITVGKIDGYRNGDVFVYNITRDECLDYLKVLLDADIKDSTTKANIEKFEKGFTSTVNIVIDDEAVLNIEYRGEQEEYSAGIIINLTKIS